jgi:hypothetical protein
LQAPLRRQKGYDPALVQHTAVVCIRQTAPAY